MTFHPINPNVVPLLQGLKPYLGIRGQSLADGVASVVNLLGSQHGQEALHTMSKMFSTTGDGDKIVTIDTAAGPITLSLNLAFVLFLILILLILSGNLLALSPGLYGSTSDNSAVEGESC